jgi:hypothetical protein
MDANQPPSNIDARKDDRCHCTNGKEEAMDIDQIPLPVAMRADELTEQDFEVLYRRALEMQAEISQADQAPRKIPLGKRAEVPAN